MENFEFYNPTKIIFGKDTHLDIGLEVKKHGKNILFHYGGKSIHNSGLYQIVKDSLTKHGLNVFELGNVVPNPRISKVYEGIKICHENNIDFILAVGGGSVIDSAKAISAGAVIEEDVWTLMNHGHVFTKGINYGCILTLPATGTEMNHRCVITNDQTLEKRGGTFMHPTFSVLNADLCATLPKHQVANGIVDMFSHLLERYFTTSSNVEVSDRLLEANMKTILNLGVDVFNDPTDYDKYSQVMWAGTIAHNYLLCAGRTTDWASHQIEHEISGMYDVAHGAGLAVVFPAWMKYVYKEDINRFAMFATRVFDIEPDFDNLEKTALAGISAFEQFLDKLEMPKTLSEICVKESDIKALALNTTRNDKIVQGMFKKLNSDDIQEILKLAL